MDKLFAKKSKSKFGSRKVTRQKRLCFEMLEARRLLIAESFDGVTAPDLPSGWSRTSTASNNWSTVGGATSHTAPNHAFVSNLNAVSDSRLISPVFVPTAALPFLNFRNSYDTEEEWDGGVLEISINGGPFSDIISAGGSFISGGYDSSLRSSDNPLSTRPAWHGNSGGYRSTIVNLPAISFNQNSVLQWRFGSDSSVGDTGWRIDTIFLSAPPTMDLGDAPDSYPVLIADNGARHTAGALFLGASVDTEEDGIHSVEANSDGADENGITFSNPIAASAITSVTAIASQAGGVLNAWLDFNRDGDWSDAGEQIFVNQSLAAGNNALSFSTPADAKSGPSYARFRLSSTSGLGVTGQASDGEVEDYRVTIATPRTWIPLGAFSATNGQVENIPNRPISGAMHTVLAHPSNPDIIYAGSVNGGVWKTTNATDVNPHWIALTDTMPSQSISALTFDLTDGSSNTIYAGTGRYSSFGRDGARRVGLFKSVNGGQSWQVINGGGVLNGKNISGVYANGNTIVVSVNVADSFTYDNIGIFRSTDGGATFTQISSGNGAATGLPGGVSYDLVYDPINPNFLYTSTVFSPSVGGSNGVYRSTNAGATWTLVSTPTMNALITDNTSNLELATGRNNEVYAGIINAGAFAGLFRSPDNGVTWTQMDSPKTNENGSDVGLNPGGGKGPSSGAPEEIAGGQGAIHFSIVADPTNANIVYVGGDRQPRSNGDTGGFPNSIGAMDFTGRLFRGDASKPTGSQFVHLTHSNVLGAAGGGTSSSSAPHADSREMTFDANGDLIEVDDGGVYRRTSPRTNTGDWFSLNGTLQVTEAHDVAWDSLSNIAMTGNQDTGTTYQTAAGGSLWNSLSTADGGDVAIDNLQLAGSNQSVRYSSFQNLGGFRRSIWDADGSFVSESFPALTPASGSSALSRSFRTPIETNHVAGGRLLIQGANGLYESTDSGATIVSIGPGVSVTSIFNNAIYYGAAKDGVDNPSLVWAATGSDVYLRTSGSGNVVAAAADPTTAAIRDLTVNSKDWSNAFVIDDNQVFQTSTSGNSWTDITGNLMSFATDLRSITHVAANTFSAIVVGTNLGAYATLASAIGTWFAVGTGLPNALVYDMDYDASDDVLILGTFGRGAWQMKDVTVVLQPNQPPTDIGLSSPLISENAGPDAVVGTLSTTDPDAGNTFTYSLVSGTGSTDNAAFNISGSTLRASSGFDFETKSSYSVRIRSTDQGGLFTEKAFTINVTNVNEAPVLTRSQANVSGNVLTTFANTGTWSDPEGDAVNLSASLGTVTKNADGTWSWSFVPSQAFASQSVTITGNDGSGNTSDIQFTIDALVAVTNSKVYYKGSSFAGSGVNAALDPSKVIAKSGATPETLSFAHLINTSRGINGLVFDVAGLSAPSLTASDFVLRMSPTGLFTESNHPPSSWTLAPVPSLINVTAGTSDTPAQVRIEWADNAIENRWLQIKVLANANTGLLSTQVYYLGHLAGETNGFIEGGAFRVRGTDASPIVSAIDPVVTVPVDNRLDLNKDGRIRGTDASTAVAAVGRLLTRITIPASGSADEGEGVAEGAIFSAPFAVPTIESLRTTIFNAAVFADGMQIIQARLTDEIFDAAIPASINQGVAPATSRVVTSSRSDAVTGTANDLSLPSLDEYFERLGRDRWSGVRARRS